MNLRQAKDIQIAIMEKLGYEHLRAGDDEDGYPRFRRWKTRRREKPPLIGVGITLPKKRTKNGYGILLTCQRKADLKSPIVAFARELAGEDLKVIFTGRPRFLGTKAKKKKSSTTTAQKIVLIGNSVGHKSETGSIGLFVRLDTKPGVFVLSNKHVLVKTTGSIGANIMSPSYDDGGHLSDDHIADVDSFEPVVAGGDNLVDCAVAEMRAGFNFDGQMVHGLPGATGPTPISGNVVPFDSIVVGEKVRRVGRSSKRSGHVAAVNINVELAGVSFLGQIAVKGSSGFFSTDGDSGSVAFNENMDALGLVFGADLAFSYCNPMETVLSELKASIL